MPHLFWKRHLALAALVSAPLIASANVASAQHPPPGADATHQATTLFTKGAELYKSKHYAEALQHFEQSYHLVPSPNSHLYIARCRRDLGEARAAYVEFGKVIDEANERGEKYAPTRDSARTERDELAKGLGFVTVEVRGGGPGTSVRVSGVEVPPDQWGRPVAVEPGPVDVVVQGPGVPPTRQMLNVARGQQAAVAVNAGGGGGRHVEGPHPVQSKGPNPLRIGAFVAGGIGVVGFGMFAGAGVASSSTYSSLNTICNGVRGCPNPVGGRQAADDKINAGKTQQAIANAGLGIGIAGIAVGATLFVVSLKSKKSDDARPTADLVVGPSWAGLQGSF